MKLIVGDKVYDTDVDRCIFADMSDEHPRASWYMTEGGDWYKTESSSNFSFAWRFHNRITLLTPKQACEDAEEYLEGEEYRDFLVAYFPEDTPLYDVYFGDPAEQEET